MTSNDLPSGIDFAPSAKSPDRFDPAMIPVTIFGFQIDSDLMMALSTNQMRPRALKHQKQFEIPPEGKKIPIIIINEEVKSATTQVNVLYCDLSMALLCFDSGLTLRSKIKLSRMFNWIRMRWLN